MVTIMVTVIQLKEMLDAEVITCGLGGRGRILPIRKEVRRMENLLPQRMSQWWPRNFHCLS